MAEVDVLCTGCHIGYGQFWEEYGNNSEQLIALCQKHALILKQKNCEKCGEICRIDISKKAFRCDKSYVVGHNKRKRCNFYVSLFKDTWFDHTKLDIETNLKFVVLFIRNYYSCQAAIEELHLSNHTLTDWASFCREVIISFTFDQQGGPIGGPNTTVEIDESKFGKRKYNVGRVIEGQWILGGICRESKDFFMVPVQKRDAATLLQVIKDKISPGTTIISDCWRAYNCLQNEGYQYLKVNHSVNFVDPISGAHTNTIERKWRDAKNLVPKYGRRKAHFIGYLSCAYFKIHFKDARLRLHHFLCAAAKLYPPHP